MLEDRRAVHDDVGLSGPRAEATVVTRARQALAAAVLLGAVALTLAACSEGATPSQPDPNDGGSAPTAEGAAGPTGLQAPSVPSFALPTLGGGIFTSDDLHGRIAVINFWASWCNPCRLEAPTLRAVSEDVDATRVQFVGVVSRDLPSDATSFAEAAGLDYPNVIDDGQLALALQAGELPTTVIADASGAVLVRHIGAISEQRLRELIERALATS